MELTDDSGNISSDDKVILIVENDPVFAKFLLDMAHENGFKGLITARGAAALATAREVKPHAVTLDINLPDIDGWRVLNRLKDDFTTRHIPVYMISTEEERERGLRMGAVGALTKPVKTKETLDATFARIREFVEPQTRSLLVVHPDEAQRNSIVQLSAGEDVAIRAVATLREALDSARETRFDAIVTDIELPDGTGLS